MAAIVLVALPTLTGTAAADIESDEAGFVIRINQARAARGLAPLTVDVRLRDVARAWSSRMATENRLYHNANLAAQAPVTWQKLGENVGYGGSVSSVADAFNASPDHYRNIVDPAVNAVGVGVVWAHNRLWVTQVFMQGPVVPLTTPSGGPGWYRLAVDGGGVFGFGAASGYTKAPTAAPVSAIASTPSGKGYWQASTDGAVFASGDARFFGAMTGRGLNSPAIGMAPTKTGGGYWLLGRDGGVFSFGDARFFGSTGAIRLNQPVVGMAPTPTGNGYWFVAADGGVFSFGDARFFGSTGSIRLNQPIVGMAPTRSGKGYWLVAADGGVFSFGDAGFFGSTGHIRLNQPVVGMAATSTGNGYWFVAADGGIFSFGDASFLGSTAGSPVGRVVGMVGGF